MAYAVAEAETDADADVRLNSEHNHCSLDDSESSSNCGNTNKDYNVVKIVASHREARRAWLLKSDVRGVIANTDADVDTSADTDDDAGLWLDYIVKPINWGRRNCLNSGRYGPCLREAVKGPVQGELDQGNPFLFFNVFNDVFLYRINSRQHSHIDMFVLHRNIMPYNMAIKLCGCCKQLDGMVKCTYNKKSQLNTKLIRSVPGRNVYLNSDVDGSIELIIRMPGVVKCACGACSSRW